MQFKITLNKPAHDYFFKGQEFGGIKIEIHGTKVRFRPVPQSSGPGIIAITERHRGGIETRLIEGSESDNLFKALTNPLGFPFFMLERVEDGWIEATPWDGPKKLPEGGVETAKPEPERFTPHLRVWPKANAKGPQGQVVYDSFPEVDPDTNAQNVVRDNLRQLTEVLDNIANLPLGKALTQIQLAQKLIRDTHDPLLAAARAEANALMGKSGIKDEDPEAVAETAAPTKAAKAAAPAKAAKASPAPAKATAPTKPQAEAPAAAAPAPTRSTRVPPRVLERIGASGGHRPLRGVKIGLRA